MKNNKGFLPTFGPAYVTFYGGPRKFKVIYDDHFKEMDEGIGEGLSYRGRVLCEISASPLGEKKRVDKNRKLTSVDKVLILLNIQKQKQKLKLN